MNRERVQGISHLSKGEKWPFPKTFKTLKAAGVASYKFDVISCDTVFTGADGTLLSEPLAGTSAVTVAPALDAAAVAAAIRRHIAERTPFLNFRADAARAGVHHWEVDMAARTVTYVGSDGGKHVEKVPPFSETK